MRPPAKLARLDETVMTGYLPGMDISEKDFQYIVLHELTHYKRRDIFYKWLVQVAVCLHWFNPLVHLIRAKYNTAIAGWLYF